MTPLGRAGMLSCCALSVGLLLAGCPAPVAPETNGLDDDSQAGLAAPDLLTQPGTWSFDGNLAGADDVRLYDLGPTRPGDHWRVTRAGTPAGQVPVRVALLDADGNLLIRELLLRGEPIEWIIRRETPALQLAVAAWEDSGPFDVDVTRTPQHAALTPRPQLVWLNFAGSDSLEIGTQRVFGFGAFEAASLGPAYIGLTTEIKAAVLKTLRAHYEPYGVFFLTSDEQPRPAEPHSVLHFGGWHAELSGTADGVDRGNDDANDAAIVFTDTFAKYAVMDLSVAQMGRMIGNVAAHELGHLLGLYHTADATHLMAQAESAWTLASELHLDPAPVDPDVFPIGRDDPSAVLLGTVGLRE